MSQHRIAVPVAVGVQRAVATLIRIPATGNVIPFQKRHDLDETRGPSITVITVQAIAGGIGKYLVSALEVERRDGNLPHIVQAAGSSGRLSDHLNRGQKHANQDANDRDDDQQFDQGKPVLAGLKTYSISGRASQSAQTNVTASHHFGAPETT